MDKSEKLDHSLLGKQRKTVETVFSSFMLIVGLGCPKQEKFMFYNCDRLGVPVSFGLGASLDFEAGNVKRAPKWMSDYGFEWLFRITQDPKRMAKRYLVDDLKIFKLALKYRKK
ncbi:WecB/TagA/CpsF family glycosyltransferase, partial [Enterococcus faecium]|uniref:WecB/TagA/CpsF family glycosyltransferase n=1 Tax=Enterococcus faecium TaxID=1352 RepID=UPI001020A2C7